MAYRKIKRLMGSSDDSESIKRDIDAHLSRLGIETPACGFFVGDGWLPIVVSALEEMIALGWDKQLHQVKEKFCGLRIYIGASSPEVHEVIRRAESKSFETCEQCGGLRVRVGQKTGAAFCAACETEYNSTRG